MVDLVRARSLDRPAQAVRRQQVAGHELDPRAQVLGAAERADRSRVAHDARDA